MPDTFRCGHEKTKENSYITSDGYSRCLIHYREAQRNQKAKRDKSVEAERKRISRAKKAGKPISVTKKDPVAHLKLPGVAVEAEYALHQAYDVARGNCDEKPAAWIDYPEDAPPQRSVARAMCADCPLFNECGEFAKATKPYIGVWAGQIYQDGKVV